MQRLIVLIGMLVNDGSVRLLREGHSDSGQDDVVAVALVTQSGNDTMAQPRFMAQSITVIQERSLALLVVG